MTQHMKQGLRMGHHARRGVIGFALAAALVGGSAGAAFATTGDTDGQSTNAHVAVAEGITMTGLSSGFTLAGAPGAVDTDNTVTYNVETNNVAGYTVTVKSENAAFVGTGLNTDTIPIGTLKVVDHNGDLADVSSSATTLVHTQSGRSIDGGDDLGSNYQMLIPVKNADTYTATLDYVATSL
jgi:hypothetical protein